MHPDLRRLSGGGRDPRAGWRCRALGVTTCATGLFESDGEGGCEPILPDHTCPPGTMEMLGDTECRPVGVIECAAGFESDGEGGCDAIGPPAPCPAGTIALLGHAVCQPLGDCGAGTWGNILDDGTTVYVDQTADATGADGTQQAPYLSIGVALAVVPPGGQIAVAAGDYAERLTIAKAVRLTGRCSALVTIRGTVFLGTPLPPVAISAGGSGTAVRGLTLTGPDEGLSLDSATQVTVEEVEVLDTGSIGVHAEAGAEVELTRVKIVRAARQGIFSKTSNLLALECVVRDTLPQSDGTLGRGINAACDLTLGVCGSLQVTRSLVVGNRDLGITAFGVDTTVTGTVVSDTLPRGDGETGRGLSVDCYSDGTCGSLSIAGSLVSHNSEAGILSRGVDTTVTNTVVRDTRPQESSGSAGDGIVVLCSDFGRCGTVQVNDSLIAGNTTSGIAISRADTAVTATIVRDTLSDSDGKYGRGIAAQCATASDCGAISVTGCLVSGNQNEGIWAAGIGTTVTDTVVRDTLPGPDGTGGRGIEVHCLPPAVCGSLSVTSSLVLENREVGIAAYGVDTAVTATVVRDTQPSPNGLRSRGISAQCFPPHTDRLSQVVRFDLDDSEGNGQVLDVVVPEGPIRIVGAATSPCVPYVPL
ncbi:MAG: hypothetical protein ABI333_03340 [bacterium]